MDNTANKMLDGRYRIEKLLGAGGMANVYKATDMKENRLVAVKVLRAEFMNNADLVRRFKNESKAISVLDHPNIVKVYDINITEKLSYIVIIRRNSCQKSVRAYSLAARLRKVCGNRTVMIRSRRLHHQAL